MGYRALPCVLAFFVLGCAQTEEVLGPVFGEKKELVSGVQEPLRLGSESEIPKASGRVLGLGTGVFNDHWSQLGGNAAHAPSALALGGAGNKVLFSTSLGEGIFTPPVAGAGLVFVLTADHRVVAVDGGTGHGVWTTPVGGKKDGAQIGGGLALEGDVIYATTGAGDLVALGARDGRELWRMGEALPFRTPPILSEGRLFAVLSNGDLVVYDQKTGKKLWSRSGAPVKAGLSLASGPSVGSGVVVVPTTLGSLSAFDVRTGAPLWEVSIPSWKRTELGVGSDLKSVAQYAVLRDGMVYGATHAGSMGAFSLKTGRALWTRPFSTLSAPWVLGNAIFAVHGSGHMVAMSRQRGELFWSTSLVDGQNRWYGPVLAGERLLVVGSEGALVSVSPQTGEILGKTSLDGTFALAPIVVGGGVYVVSNEGRLFGIK